MDGVATRVGRASRGPQGVIALGRALHGATWMRCAGSSLPESLGARACVVVGESTIGAFAEGISAAEQGPGLHAVPRAADPMRGRHGARGMTASCRRGGVRQRCGWPVCCALHGDPAVGRLRRAGSAGLCTTLGPE